jgi:hypothetical protein
MFLNRKKILTKHRLTQVLFCSNNIEAYCSDFAVGVTRVQTHWLLQVIVVVEAHVHFALGLFVEKVIVDEIPFDAIQVAQKEFGNVFEVALVERIRYGVVEVVQISDLVAGYAFPSRRVVQHEIRVDEE